MLRVHAMDSSGLVFQIHLRPSAGEFNERESLRLAFGHGENVLGHRLLTALDVLGARGFPLLARIPRGHPVLGWLLVVGSEGQFAPSIGGSINGSLSLRCRMSFWLR